MTIFSRTKPELINKKLFNKFSENNIEIAWKYAFSHETSRKNNVELDFGSVEYDIQYDNILIGDILNFDSKIVTFKIIYPFDFSLKLSSVIRICLKLSANRLNKLIAAKVISIQEKYLQKNLFPKLLKRKKSGESLRIWVPACATGEEAYSLAMMLLEINESQTNNTPVQIFATDPNEHAISKARVGVYTKQELAITALVLNKDSVPKYLKYCKSFTAKMNMLVQALVLQSLKK